MAFTAIELIKSIEIFWFVAREILGRRRSELQDRDNLIAFVGMNRKFCAFLIEPDTSEMLHAISSDVGKIASVPQVTRTVNRHGTSFFFARIAAGQ